jgi:hypothetical protein
MWYSKVYPWIESISESTSETLRGYGGGSVVRGDVSGVEDNEDTVESSEKSEVQLEENKPEPCSEPWNTII